MSYRFLGGCLLAGLALATPAFGQQDARAARRPNLSAVKKEVVRLTNAFRKEKKRGRLRVNDKLMRTAQSFAD